MHYVYHPDHAAKIVDTDEYYKLLEAGWFDTPAKFSAKKVEAEKAPEVAPTPIEMNGLAGGKLIQFKGDTPPVPHGTNKKRGRPAKAA